MEYRNLPDLKGWAALRAVVERGGVSAAAEALNIGQSAVTKRLRALEDCYDMPLTERIGGRLHLTQAGEKVYVLAVQTLDRQAGLAKQLEEEARGENHLRLEATMALGEHFLPDMLIRFQEQYPEYRVDSRLAYWREIQRHLAGGLVDLALMESAPDHPDLLVQKWMDDELWLVCGPGHPLWGAEMIPVDELQGLRYALRERGSSPREALDEACRRIGLTLDDIALEVGSTDTIVEILARGHHVGFLPRFAVRQKVADGQLHRVKASGFRIMRTLWIARHRGTFNHPVAEAFIAMIRNDGPW